MRLITFLLALTFCINAHALRIVDRAQAPLSGVQIFVLSPEYGRDYDRFFVDMADKGVDTVFFRVFHNAKDRVHGYADNPCPQGGVYFATQNACTVSDMLPDVVAAGRRHGVAVYAWMATRSLSFLKTPATMSQSFTPTGFTEGYGAKIFDGRVRETLKRLMKDIARTGVDGILLQDDYIMKYTEGADRLACNKFTTDTGVACNATSFFDLRANTDGSLRFGSATPNGQLWYRWKAAQLQNLFAEMRNQTRIINPNMKWALNVYYETPIYPDQGLAWYAQDLKGMWDAGADYIAVMAYQEQIMKEKNLDRGGFLNFISELSAASLDSVNSNARVIFKVQATEFGTGRPVNVQELNLLCNRLNREGAVSIVQLPIYNGMDILPVCGFK
ncbi:MAG: poly-beta-1,6-N-acetyl-D-glucosamine N-deacetylase PgaB [Deferribacteraceae bacterium]|jgi:biofilm PGA synthesis lipoprotein PgaB|nr:poly-beta-1,6-N-acetyl-D-glucosamine N-deacetylase PgaB [Deferribacteraceae bacterium]